MYSFRNDYSEGAHPQVLQCGIITGFALAGRLYKF